MSFWLLSDCQDWGQGGVYYNRLHIEHVHELVLAMHLYEEQEALLQKKVPYQ